MGTDCGPVLANLYLHYYEFRYIENKMKENKNNLSVVRKFNHTFRYIDDLGVINNNKFYDEVSKIYPNTLKLTRQNNDGDDTAQYMDLDIKIVNNEFRFKVYDKRDNFNFVINSFPYLSANIHENNMLNVYVSQLVRYARICTDISDFHDKHKYLCNKLINNGFNEKKLINKFKVFGNKHGNLMKKWNYKASHNSLYIRFGIINRNN